MTRSDFNTTHFTKNISLVAYFDGTGSGETNDEVVDAIKGSLPGVAHRFLHDGLYVGVASCGYGDEDDDTRVDCSQRNVSWLPDVKFYGENDTVGISLLRGQFGDRRDVQIGEGLLMMSFEQFIFFCDRLLTIIDTSFASDHSSREYGKYYENDPRRRG